MGKVFGLVSSSARPSGRRRLSFALAVVLASVMGGSALTAEGAAAGGPPSGAGVPGAVEIRRLPFTTQVSTVDRPDASNGADCAGNGHAVWYAYPKGEYPYLATACRDGACLAGDVFAQRRN